MEQSFLVRDARLDATTNSPLVMGSGVVGGSGVVVGGFGAGTPLIASCAESVE
jgi:hypothetical protein